MRPQQEIDNLLNQLMATYNGQRVDYWGYPGECLSYNKRWLDTLRNGHVGGHMEAPASTNGYGSGYYANPPEAVRQYFNPEPYNPNIQYPRGSMFTFSGSGHIGILLDNQPGAPTAKVTQQNADPDGSPVKVAQRSKSRIDGVLVIKVAAPPPLPPPVPQGPPYQIVETYPQGRLFKVIPGKNKWGMNFDNYPAMAAHPVNTSDENTLITVHEKLLHNIGYYYYRTAGDPDGWNTLDCIEFVPPPPPPPVYIPPAAPLVVPKINYYELKTTVPYFKSATDAKRDVNALSTIDKGQYILLKEDEHARHITKKNTDKESYWINDLDNKEPVPPPTPIPTVMQPEVPVQPTLPVDAPPTDITLPVDTGSPIPTPVESPNFPLNSPKPQYLWLRSDMQSTRLTSTNSIAIPIHDLEGKYPKQMFPAKRTEDYSMYAEVGNKVYYIPDRCRVKGWMYGIEESFLTDLPEPSIFDRDADGRNDIAETGGLILDFIATTGNRTWQTVQKLVTSPKVIEAKQRVGKSIDGFKTRSKK